MLPTASKGRAYSASRPAPIFAPYLRRIIKWQQMDIEYTFWQMLHLCTSPKVVYQHTKYHKQTKNQWARDDPAFVVILCLFLVFATSAFCAAYGASFTHGALTVFSAVLIHFMLAGTVMATICWFLTNSYLREEPNSHVVEQRVEWLYAFDVHCNSFFPAFIILYVIQYFLSPVLVAHGFIPVLLSNLLFMVAITYYNYLNFLGYDVLPFLDRTTFFLYPIGLAIILSPLSSLFLVRLLKDASGKLFDSTDASAKIDDVKSSPNKESAKVTKTVQTVDVTQSAGQSQDVTRPVEIVHEIPAKEASSTKKE